MKLSKIARVLLVSVALLTVGAPIVSASPAYPQAYWMAQPTNPSQPGQQAPGYGYGNGYGYGCCGGAGYYGGMW
ncbi:hypothetical protein [Desulfosporosinus sp.]|uniref:hypothetical protein n=1 Tax=Desulfosporosinus sp. TaxID=157907 RepID=UPI002321C9CF|nr:hypothetical protein [Desulfosporosinus sp.]MDA8221798.1 hypothetical protein [Desulfitobacterium hafniense]